MAIIIEQPKCSLGRKLRSNKASSFWPFLNLKVGQLGGRGQFWSICGQIFLRICEFWSKKLAIWPVLKIKVASKKSLCIKGFLSLWPLSHFFFLITIKKKTLFLYKIRKIIGQLARRRFSALFVQILMSARYFGLAPIRGKNILFYEEKRQYVW